MALPTTWLAFADKAGQFLRWDRRYKRASSTDKRTLFWDFFSSDEGRKYLNAPTVYSGVPSADDSADGGEDDDDDAVAYLTVGEMMSLGMRSIEHVVPKSQYVYNALEGADDADLRVDKLRNGATMNPLNFLPCHATVNSRRNQRHFDFDGDEVPWRNRAAAHVNHLADGFQGGTDHEGEWVVPLVTRGDVARCVMYMIVLYKLTYVKAPELRVLAGWMRQDPPSAYEVDFNAWLRVTRVAMGQKKDANARTSKPLQNPFVLHPELAQWQNLRALLNDTFGNTEYLAGITPPGEHRPRPPPASNAPLRIASVMPNARGTDSARTEWVQLANAGAHTLRVAGREWALHIVHSRRASSPRVFPLPDIELRSGERVKIVFTVANVLPNRGPVTVELRHHNSIVSAVRYGAYARVEREYSVSPLP